MPRSTHERVRLAGRLVVPVVTVVYAAAFLASASRLRSMASLAWPLAIIALLVVTVAVVAFREVRPTRARSRAHGASVSDAPQVTGDEAGGAWRKVVCVVALFVLYVWLIPRLGFYVASSFFTVAAFAVLGISWLGVAIRTAIFVGGSYIVFSWLLRFRMPTGTWLPVLF